jgi:hypothetical protein
MHQVRPSASLRLHLVQTTSPSAEKQSVLSQGFLARLRGNDDGTFTGSPDELYQLDGIPVAVATGRFRTDVSVDGIVVVTSPASGQGNGKVQVFVP